MTKPKVNSDGEKELKKVESQVDKFSDQLAGYNPFDVKKQVEESEPQTKMSTREANRADALYIKPVRSLNRTNGEKNRTYFKEEHRALRDRDWEYVKCIVENNEIKGEDIEVWTAKWGCDPAHFWRVPVNKPVMIPRMLAEQLASCKYRRLKTEDRVTSNEGFIQQYGALIVDSVQHRIDARPVGFGFTSMAS